MLRTTLCWRQAAVGRIGVSPYSVFLIRNKGNSHLKKLAFEDRGRKCANLWHQTPEDSKNDMRRQAARMPVFPQRRHLPQDPSNFAKFVRRYWTLAPKKLDFKGKVRFLSEHFKNSQ